MIEFIRVSKSFDEKLFEDLSFTLKSGERLGIVGKSGIGKTTIVNMILGFVKPDEGEVINDFQKMSTVFQEDRLVEEISALSNLKAVSKKNDAELSKILTELGIENPKQIVKKMSGGMKRRVAIARAVAYGGDILLLDEPLRGLDIANKKNAIQIVNREYKNKSVILITHDLDEIYEFQIENVINLDNY